MHWKIWYINNLTVEGYTSAEWADAPEDGVIGIAVRYGVDIYGRTLAATYHSGDWYWMFENNIHQNTESTWIQNYWVPNPAPEGSISKRGIWTTDDDMLRVERELVEWVK